MVTIVNQELLIQLNFHALLENIVLMRVSKAVILVYHVQWDIIVTLKVHLHQLEHAVLVSIVQVALLLQDQVQALQQVEDVQKGIIALQDLQLK